MPNSTDRAVAVAMGWTLVERPGGDDHWQDLDGRLLPVPFWNPSTDILDAWRAMRWCVESFGAVEMTWDMENHGREPGDIIWIGIPDSPGGNVSVLGDGPVAICNALLLASEKV